MKFSVITVCLNSEETIEKTIKSVLNQKGVDIEYIIIDGLSTDNTLEIIKSFESQIAYWSSEPDGGIYQAMNKGISVATGDIVSFINSNDWYEEDALLNVQQKMSESPCDLVCGKVARVKNGKVVNTSIKPSSETDLYYKMFYLHPGIFARRTVFSEFGDFDIRYRICADYDWLLRVYNKGARIAYIDTVVSYFSMGGVSSGFKTLAERKTVSEKNLPPALYDQYYPKIVEEYEKGVLAHKYQYIVARMPDDPLLAREVKKALSIESECSFFGAGMIARMCYDLFLSLGIKVGHIYDNDKNMQGKDFNGITVESPAYIRTDEMVVIATTLYADEIKKQLLACRVVKNIKFNDIMKTVVLCAESLRGRPIDLEEDGHV